jgi:hypothetical protein
MSCILGAVEELQLHVHGYMRCQKQADSGTCTFAIVRREIHATEYFEGDTGVHSKTKN